MQKRRVIPRHQRKSRAVQEIQFTVDRRTEKWEMILQHNPHKGRGNIFILVAIDISRPAMRAHAISGCPPSIHPATGVRLRR